MTELRPPFDDEALSAVLDGEAPADLVARVQDDPAARARLEELRRAAAAVAGPVTSLPAATVDQLIDRAVAAAGTEAPDGTTGGDATVLPGPGHRDGPPPVGPPVAAGPDGGVAPAPVPRPKRSANPQFRPYLVAAAIVALAAIGIGLIWAGTNGSDTGDQNAGAPPSRAEPTTTAEGGTDGAAPKQTPDQDATTSTGDGGSSERPPTTGTGAGEEPGSGSAVPGRVRIVDLGTFADGPALRTRVAGGLPRDRGTTTEVRRDQLTRCDTFLQATLAGQGVTGGAIASATATVDGRSYFVYEYALTDNPEGATRLVTAADTESCDVLITFQR